jgi:hypothetical protein
VDLELEAGLADEVGEVAAVDAESVAAGLVFLTGAVVDGILHDEHGAGGEDAVQLGEGETVVEDVGEDVVADDEVPAFVVAGEGADVELPFGPARVEVAGEVVDVVAVLETAGDAGLGGDVEDAQPLGLDLRLRAQPEPEDAVAGVGAAARAAHVGDAIGLQEVAEVPLATGAGDRRAAQSDAGDAEFERAAKGHGGILACSRGEFVTRLCPGGRGAGRSCDGPRRRSAAGRRRAG